MKDSKRAGSMPLVVITFVGLVSLWLLSPGQPMGVWGAKIANRFDQIVYLPLLKLFEETILTPAFLIVTGATLVIERLIPAQKGVKFWSASRRQDFVWFFYETVLHASIVVLFTGVIYAAYDQHFKFLTMTSLLVLPEWVRIVIAILVQDLAHYTQHWVHHKVPFLWSIHAVHHSQKELNFFTDFRYHVIEYCLREFFLIVPFLILGIPAPAVVFYAVFRRWYTHFYHANIRTNLGPLRYILVTPQSHRVHHSQDRNHFDKNFGSIFVFWDFLFRTQYTGWEEYPETGIPDAQFPHETETDLISLLVMPVRQMVYAVGDSVKKIAAQLKIKGAPNRDVESKSERSA